MAFVEYLEVDMVGVLVDASHNFVVSYDAVDVASGLEGFDKNGVGRLVVGDHDVFITGMGADREGSG